MSHCGQTNVTGLPIRIRDLRQELNLPEDDWLYSICQTFTPHEKIQPAPPFNFHRVKRVSVRSVSTSESV